MTGIAISTLVSSHTVDDKKKSCIILRTLNYESYGIIPYNGLCRMHIINNISPGLGVPETIR